MIFLKSRLIASLININIKKIKVFFIMRRILKLCIPSFRQNISRSVGSINIIKEKADITCNKF